MIFYAHDKANKPADDGDLHIAGYDKKIGLPIVAEIMNAADEEDALDTIHKYEGKGKPDESIEITGAWRLWAEHIATGAHYAQPTGYKSIKNTGPDHVFEIHPVFSVIDLDLNESLHDIDGYNFHDSKKAFKHYTTRSCSLTSSTKKITIETGKALYNYCDFWIKVLTTEKYKVGDGLFVYCDVLETKFKPATDNVPSKTVAYMIRMAIPENTEAYDAVKDLNAGEFLHVIGIPRISLVEVAKRVKQKKDLNKELPFEMIVVGLK